MLVAPAAGCSMTRPRVPSLLPSVLEMTRPVPATLHCVGSPAAARSSKPALGRATAPPAWAAVGRSAPVDSSQAASRDDDGGKERMG